MLCFGNWSWRFSLPEVLGAPFVLQLNWKVRGFFLNLCILSLLWVWIFRLNWGEKLYFWVLFCLFFSGFEFQFSWMRKNCSFLGFFWGLLVLCGNNQFNWNAVSFTGFSTQILWQFWNLLFSFVLVIFGLQSRSFFTNGKFSHLVHIFWEFILVGGGQRKGQISYLSMW